jgi:hypothetical protein
MPGRSILEAAIQSTSPGFRHSSPNKAKEKFMFSVIFEVHPKTEQWDVYLGNAKMLRPELEQVDGFVDNIRYRSLTREGWIL